MTKLRQRLMVIALVTVLIATRNQVVLADYVIAQELYPESTAVQARIGQTFTTIGAGWITRIEVRVVQAGTTSLRIYAGSQSPGNPGVALYTQDSISIGCSDCWNTVDLVTPLPVGATTQYTFEFTSIRVGYSSADPYSGGVLWVDGASSASDDVAFRVSVREGNQPPVADAGPDQSVDTNAGVTLDGSSSSDPDGDLPLSYGWMQTGGPAVTLSDVTAQSPAFTAPSDPTVVTFTLTVTDSLGLADLTPDEVVVTVNNQPPLADAGPDQSVDTNAGVTLDGSGSSDPDGDLPLTYGWIQTGGPAVTLSDVTAQSPAFTAPGDPTVITFTLAVTDSLGLADATPDEVVVTVNNQPPVADAGPDQSVATNAGVALDGSGSSDPDGDLPLTYGWMQTGGPAVTLSDVTAQSPTFTAPGDPAVLTFTLAVTDSLGLADPTPDEVVVTVGNQAPVADAGPDQSVDTNVGVTLDGSGSSDPDGDLPLAYLWTQTAGPAVTLSDVTAQSPTFTAPDDPAALTFTLVVTDSLGLVDPTPDQVVVTVNNQAPVAYAGPNQNVYTNAGVTLLGGGSSDPDGDLPLAYLWTQTAGPAVTLSDVTAQSPTFTAPDDPAVLRFALVVTDSLGLADPTPDEVRVTVYNRPPVAHAGPDQTVDAGALVTLDGSGSSDPDGDLPLAYGWVQAGGPAVTLSDATAQSPTFTAPGDLVALSFTLVVTDSLGLADPTPDEVIISVSNRPPVADAGPDQSVDTNDLVALNGSGSSDPDGDLPLAHLWTQTAGPAVSLSDATAQSPTFTAPGDPAALTFTLAVTDSLGLADPTPDQVVVTVNNRAPVADAGPDQSVDTKAGVTLDGSGSGDPDGDLPLAYLWTQTSGPAVTLSDVTAQSPTFAAPDEPTVLIFTLVVTDALGTASPPDQVSISVEQSEWILFLPFVARSYVIAPDLVVESVTAVSNDVQVVIENRGDAPVVDEFWVDVYIDPHTPPTAVNQTWDQLGSQGLVWAVLSDALPNLVPGGTITLLVGDAYYQAEYSRVSWPLPVDTQVYAQVDSLNLDTTYGAVQETHEIVGGGYNNVSGPVFSTASIGHVPMPSTGDRLILSVNLPRRP